MDCARTRNYMHGYLDRELDPVTASGIEAHLQSCAACAQAYALQTSLHKAIKGQATYYTAPEALAARVRAGFRTTRESAGKTYTPPHTPRRQWLALFAAVAASVLITWTAVIQLETGSRDERIGSEVLAGHARAVLTNHLAEIASSDRHTVKPWLSSKLDFSPPVTDLTTAGFPLVGARLDYLDNRPVAALVYRHRQHVIDLFIWPDTQASAAAMQASSKQGFNLLHWTHAGMTFWAISDLNPAAIRTFAETYMGLAEAAG
ncbi:MAG: anti-sigma factor [Candidatus Accumulibacter phosphatis]|jgi:mycothiol system anti-sigma-R factor|uniref:Anti-sigma factor n=1 Tax=Candidatus Accumulibacter contiguus TaxID=2954381 RepID=A0ABX1T7Z3_9PROT|nr:MULTISPECIES: anti-sigma factor [Candidatus Accumulibacter]MBL8407370.1 anti-sigma factor [Accumulibacter sp.]NMQ05753.1 anti-sigma factor [Candidatus Accumulibacter contiguus]HRD87925.1 anti-sigma factor [Accumulibacter sp.]